MTTGTDQPCDSHFLALYQVARTVNSSLDVMQVLHTIVRGATEALSAKGCSLRLLSPDGKQLLFGAGHGLSAGYRAKGPVIVEQSRVDREAMAAGKPVHLHDARSDPRFQYRDEAREEGIVSVLVVPMCVQEHPIGVLRVYTGDTRAFSDSDLALAEAIASLSALAIENGRLYERLDRNYQAAIDFSQREFD